MLTLQRLLPQTPSGPQKYNELLFQDTSLVLTIPKRVVRGGLDTERSLSPAEAREALWLCIHLPCLPLSVFESGGTTPSPLVISEGALIVAADAAAQSQGARAGMRLSAAQTLIPELYHRERRQETEKHHLYRLAGWALQYTSHITPQPPDALLLEIGASLRYFGGLEALREQLRQGLDSLGHRATLGIAPTATAAWALARAGWQTPILQRASLGEALADLPLAALAPQSACLETLRGLGVHVLGDALGLPRDGLARRFGEALLDRLDRAVGRGPDPRPRWRPPWHYHAEIELTSEVHTSGQLVFGIKRMLQEMTGFLRGIERGVASFQLDLGHRYQAATPLTIGLLTVTRDVGHLLELTRQCLERIYLPGPVTSLTLRAEHLHPLTPQAPPLLETEPTAAGQSAWPALVERLSARLGEQNVQAVAARAEHRPERAWRYITPGEHSEAPPTPERPLWLLTEPLALELHHGEPYWHGSLRIQQGPERIESGWWDGQDIARDYFVASNDRGQRLWIYRECRGARAWYLHGLFA